MKIDLKIFKSFMELYYNWRYWGNLYKSMKRHSQFNNTNKELSLSYINKPGIAFSFDDSYRINDWYQYGKDLFGYYDVKVTFNINAIHHFEGKRKHTQEEIDKLLELQSSGHEIAHHGYKHRKATDYSNEFGLNKWVEDEIVSLFNWMENQSHSITKEKFKKPVSFAFPHFVYNFDNIKELIPRHFKIARGHMIKDNLTSFNHTGFAPSICLDAFYSSNLYFVKKMMKIAKKSGRNLIITSHSILPKEIDWADFGWGEESIKSGTWRTTPTTIQAIIDAARKSDLEFYTTSEVAGVATFIDPNFEKYVRKLISNPSAEWIPISELCLIKEMDLSNKGISNLDGIQYFINLEKLNLNNNKITDFRLLEKLPKLKGLNSDNNPVKSVPRKRLSGV
ncbi:polysaccharide deacetylase family protein [Neobacillus novalis]|uniref:Polysaccharide deacetylase family protein n=1 Tax=Neobacillus novalis TaxID=220687 RepID=A0AA95MV48_9BACI|nr:polysaccharide deacetylase family protein [Neobacillus novalis]WHY89109.1 polysaccharide deacetylase family protein [Neobacillus novalis]